MTDLVVYYSRTNKTKEVAGYIAQAKNAELLEVKDNKNRNGPVQYVASAVSMLFGRNTSITYEKTNLQDYETIYVGSPVWTSGPTPAIIEFINENDFTGKDVVTFATFLANKGEATTNKMNELIQKKGGSIVKSFSFSSIGGNLKDLTLNELD